MQRLYFLILIFTLAMTIQGFSQGVNQIRIEPTNPTSADTILVVSDFSYYGNCDFGLVYSYTYTTDSAILILPTYCGYFSDSTLCERIDTFKVAPLSSGEYHLTIEYHQGSICPISDFDATIAEFDTTLIISGTNKTEDISLRNDILRIYPNPATDILYIESLLPREGSRIVAMNTLGQIIFRNEIDEAVKTIDVSHWHGPYYVQVIDKQGRTVKKFVFVD